MLQNGQQIEVQFIAKDFVNMNYTDGHDCPLHRALSRQVGVPIYVSGWGTTQIFDGKLVAVSISINGKKQPEYVKWDCDVADELYGLVERKEFESAVLTMEFKN